MQWRIPVQTMFDQNLEAGTSLDSSILDYGAVLDQHFAQVNCGTEVGTGMTSVVLWGSLDSNSYYPLSDPAGTLVAVNALDLYVLGGGASGTPARYVYVRVSQANDEVQEVTIYQTGGQDG